MVFLLGLYQRGIHRCEFPPEKYTKERERFVLFAIYQRGIYHRDIYVRNVCRRRG